MKDFMKRISLIPGILNGSIVAVRVGKGCGITVYTGKHNMSTLQKVSTKLFQLAYGIR